MSKNRIELIGFVLTVPELRITPAGTPVLRLEVSSGEGPDALRLAIVMAGAKAEEIGSRIGAGKTIRVTGKLRPSRERRASCGGQGVEILAAEISEVTPGSGSL